MKHLLLLPLVIALAGCYSVPATKVSFDPVTHAISIRSPKDIEISGLKFVVSSNGQSTVTIDTYKSKSNIEAIRAIAKLNMESQKNAIEVGGVLIEKLADGATP